MTVPEPHSNHGMSELVSTDTPAILSDSRRLADGGLAVLIGDLAPAKSTPETVRLFPLGADAFTDGAPSPAHVANATLLIGMPGDEVLLLAAADAHLLPRGGEDEDLRRRAAAAASAWRLERLRVTRRIRMADWLMVYIDELDAACSAEEVCDALIDCAPLVVGAYTALVFRADVGGEHVSLHAVQESRTSVALPPLTADAAASLAAPSIVSEVEARPGTGGVHAALAPVFHAFHAAHLVCTPVSEGLWLVLVERRRDRVFTADERDALQWLVKQARRCLARL